MVDIRITSGAEEPAIRGLHLAAFGPEEGPSVAELTVALLHDPTAQPLLSLIASDHGTPIGHILFTRVQISGSEESAAASILCPLAVLPNRQREGVGTQLMERGTTLLKEVGCDLVFVLGHPDYYPRCGFQPAGRLGFTAPYPIPEKNAEAWMVLALSQGVIVRVRGTVRCADVLNKPEYWRE